MKLIFEKKTIFEDGANPPQHRLYGCRSAAKERAFKQIQQQVFSISKR
jgi:hypothetical protein